MYTVEFIGGPLAGHQVEYSLLTDVPHEVYAIDAPPEPSWNSSLAPTEPNIAQSCIKRVRYVIQQVSTCRFMGRIYGS